MKSEFTLALNQICSERNLPREIITQVLESALVTSYRKNANIMTSQNVAVKVDIEKGDMRVFVEKEVVEDVMDDRTEVTLEEARLEKPDAVLGDCIMVDVTVKDFGRIAAQNVKQMIVQKLREAERDFQYNTFAEREGEIVHGVVQNVTPAGLVLNLGRAEGILPRKEQIPGERLENQQRLRAYVTEVKRNSRGPQIMLSRAHKNMLRRLLEIEVPEIQKGQVEIKSIAREPGSRSKVAVAALLEGIDPVGACVGQRGARVQSIVNELNGEKIDVIEWSPDPTVFITKALGPAKVLAVHPSLDNKDQKSGTVIVPDDQLSLAIGREGQNARLAAKLTGWHIDIKSGSEALGEVLVKIAENASLRDWAGPEIVQAAPTLREMLVRQRAMPVALSADEFLIVKRSLDSVYAYSVQHAHAGGAVADETRTEELAPSVREEARNAALAAIPSQSYSMSIEELGLSPRVMQHIIAAGVLSVGQLMERQVRGDIGLLAIEGVGTKALAEIKTSLDRITAQFSSVEIASAVEATPVELPQAEAPEAVSLEREGIAVEETDLPEDLPESSAAALSQSPVAEIPEVELAAVTPSVVEDEEGRTPEQIFLAAMGQTEETEGGAGAAAAKSTGKKKDKDKGKKPGRDRVLVFDEELGRTVVQRSRKPGRTGEVFDDLDDIAIDEE
ncbi:MAG: transcription termination factor NusA [Chloroflexi bacterium]|nr:transcription termination factor NusA [Chloroflexota bacterium]